MSLLYSKRSAKNIYILYSTQTLIRLIIYYYYGKQILLPVP